MTPAAPHPDPISALAADLAHAGIALRIHPTKPDTLCYTPRTAMTPDLLARLKAHKPNLLALLRSCPAQLWARRASALLSTVSDDALRVALRDAFEERTADCEYNGNLSRDEAERMAFEEVRDTLATWGTTP